MYYTTVIELWKPYIYASTILENNNLCLVAVICTVYVFAHGVPISNSQDTDKLTKKRRVPVYIVIIPVITGSLEIKLEKSKFLTPEKMNEYAMSYWSEVAALKLDKFGLSVKLKNSNPPTHSNMSIPNDGKSLIITSSGDSTWQQKLKKGHK